MDELSFKIVKVYDARDEVIVRSSNFHRCILRLAACIFWTTSEVWRGSHLSSRSLSKVSTTRRRIMVLQPHLVEIIFGMVLAMALIIAATTWALSPNPAAPIPPSEVIYQPQHWNAY
jgi:hypothetical protein